MYRLELKRSPISAVDVKNALPNDSRCALNVPAAVEKPRGVIENSG